MRNTFVSIILSLIIGISAAQAAGVEQFKDGDRVAFVGDSITHNGTYHSYVYLYYLTRFPGRNIRFFNKGISGNRAENVLYRFDEDIAVVKPTVSTLMLGMNDVGRSLYSRNMNDEKMQQAQERLEVYYRDLNAIISKFKAINSEVVFITPSLYDQTSEMKRKNNFGVNDALGKCADFVKETAAKAGQGYVDFYDSMTAINARIQQTDKTATLTRGDRVHPGPDPGHVIMAYQFLKAQEVPKYVSKMELDAGTGKVVGAANCEISEVKTVSGGLSFVAHEGALPFPETEAIAKGLKLVPFTQDFNQQLLSVKNLKPGEYDLSIDGRSVGIYTTEELSEGVNLAVNQKTPQYKQALKVKALNEKRASKQGLLRNAAYAYYKSKMDKADIDKTNEAEVKAYLAKKLQEVEGGRFYKYVKNKYNAYWEIAKNTDAINAELKDLHVELYKANKPVPHTFTITPAKSKRSSHR